MTRTHIDVAEMDHHAALLRAKADEIRTATVGIGRKFVDLTQGGGWNDSRSNRFSPDFKSGVENIMKLAERCDQYAAWLEQTARSVQEYWGDTLDVS